MPGLVLDRLNDRSMPLYIHYPWALAQAATHRQLFF
jgi:hypothetical protein